MFTFLIEKIGMHIALQTKTPELTLSKQRFDKNVVWETQLVVMTNNTRFLLCFWVLNKRKTGSKSNISYYRIPFSTDPESLSLRKRWIAAIRRENWTDDQIDNSRICSKHFISGKSKKTLMDSRSLVFLFVSVAFKILLLRQAIKRQRFSGLCPIGIFLYSKYCRKEKKFSWLIWKAD